MIPPLRTERDRQALTINALADKAGVNERSIRRAENFEAVNGDTREKLAAALDVPVTDLWPDVRVGSITNPE